MRHSWLTGMAILGMVALAGCAGGQPDIAVSASRHDFGQVEQGQVVTTEIAMRNTGKGDLTIEAVSTSCGCTSAQVEPAVIPPGGEGRLIIRYDSGVHPDSGPVRRHVYIASNDPFKKEVEVVITANVQLPTR